MFCSQCGKEINPDTKFCSSCGAKVSVKQTNLDGTQNASVDSESESDNKKIQNKQPLFKNDKTEKKMSGKSGGSKKKLIAIISALSVAVIAILIIIIVKSSDKSRSDKSKGGFSTGKLNVTENATDNTADNNTMSTDTATEEQSNNEDEGMEIKEEDLAEYDLYEDVEEYYTNNSTIIAVTNANESKDVYSEKQAVQMMTDLGFDQYEVIYDYSMDGRFYSESMVASDSEDKRPMYETYYIDANENVWSIYLINDQIMAYPVSYNLQSETSVPVVLSEKESVVSYDYTANKFYETIPNESELIVAVAGNINKELLDKMTKEEIDKYVN